MKKSLIAIALAAMVAPAWGAEVVSSNIVGYQKITLYPGLNMIGGLFQGVGTGQSLTLQAQFSDDATKSKFGTGDDVADTIMTYDGEHQEYDKTYYFYADPDNPDPVYDYTWDDTSTDDITPDSLAGAKGGWYRNRANAAIQLTMAGEVPTNAVYTFTLEPGLNFVANPYPQEIALNGQFFSVDHPVYGTGDDVADTIMTYDGEHQEYDKTYYFYADPDNPDPAYDYTWDDTATDDITDFAVQPGQGFWYRHRGSGATLTFTRPYAVPANN